MSIADLITAAQQKIADFEAKIADHDTAAAVLRTARDVHAAAVQHLMGMPQEQRDAIDNTQVDLHKNDEVGA